MTHIPACGLVLNINTPNYFESPKKKSSDNSFATISAVKPKLSGGVAFKFSSVQNKLRKVPKSIALRKPTLNGNSSKISNLKTKSVNFDSSISSYQSDGTSFNSGYQSNLNKLNEKNTDVNNRSVSKNAKNNVSDKKQSNKTLKSKRGKSGPVSSSLFSKNPVIPKLTKNVNESLHLPNVKLFQGEKFATLDVSPRIVSSIVKMGFDTMMKVQQLGIPPILKGNDALIRSHTGSGKTLVYAIPIVQKLMMKEPKLTRVAGIRAVVVVPTRELALQSYQCFEKLCKSCIWVVPGYLIGGEKRKCEKSRLRKGINILIATPGRLADHIQATEALNLSRVEFLVIDEADRMTEMGYEKSLLSIVASLDEQVSWKRQTMLLSATLTAAVEKIVGLSLKDPTKISIGQETDDNLNTSLSMPATLSQYYMIVPAKLRLVSLAAFLIDKWKVRGEGKILVFMNTQHMIDFHVGLFSHVVSSFGRKIVSSSERKPSKRMSSKSGQLEDEDDDECGSDMGEENENDIHFFKLHGNMSQEERSAVFKTFQECTTGVLFCTDVAARGLHLPEIHWIVQYNPAYTISDYVHRSGRTARANNRGSAVVFLDPSEIEFVSWLEECMIRIREMKYNDNLKCLVSPAIYADKSMMSSNRPDNAATELQHQFEQAIDCDHNMYEMATGAYTSFIRSYASIPKHARVMFDFRKIHLGHYAKSFALKEAPNVIGQRRARFVQNDYDDYGGGGSRKRSYDGSQATNVPRRKPLSEFDSGLSGIGETNVKKRTRGKGLNAKPRKPLAKRIPQ